jgi:GH25 family lysozyme M1 (1,4-beta-N-acetylmuramidase)
MGVFPGDVWPYGAIDISRYQNTIDANIALSKPIHAIGFKAGQGNIIDPNFRYWWGLFRGKLPRFAYFYFEPVTSPEDQAKTFFDALGGDYGDMLFVDIEQNGDPSGRFNTTGKAYPALPADDFFGMLFDFITLCDNRFMDPIGLYSRASFWDNPQNIPPGMYSKKHRRALSLVRRLLWVANYYQWSALGPSLRPIIPRDWGNRFDIWQFSADKPYPNMKGREYGVGSTSIDLNVFNAKTSAEFRNRFGFLPRVVPTVSTRAFPYLVRSSSSLFIRADANEQSPRVGSINVNTSWMVYGTKKDSLGRSWYRITPTGDTSAKYIASWLCQAL